MVFDLFLLINSNEILNVYISNEFLLNFDRDTLRIRSHFRKNMLAIKTKFYSIYQ